jgi:acetylglutamate synthase
LGSIYISPNHNNSHLEEFNSVLNSILEDFPSCKIIICGDFNLNLLIENKIVKDFKNTINSLGLYQLVETFTYPSDPINSSNRTLLDLLLVNDKNLWEINVKESIAKSCDHLIIECHLKLFKEKAFQVISNTMFLTIIIGI